MPSASYGDRPALPPPEMIWVDLTRTSMLLRVQQPGVQMLSTRDQQVVLERDRGDTIVQIGRRHGISHQRVSVLMARATEFVNAVDLDLMIARKTGEQCAYLIPHGPDYSLALDFSSWLIKRLRDRGMDLAVETRRASNGLALLLTDTTPARRRAS
jgi:hypothetical protein